MLTRNRPPNQQGTSHGGVAVLFDENKCSFSELKMRNPEDFEVLVCSGRLVGFPRPVVIIGCYLPPGYTVPRASGALEYVRGVVTEMKRKYADPFLVVAGDFNQWQVDEALVDFRDLVEAGVGPTRGTRSIDRLFTNLPMTAAGTVAPLEPDLPDDGAPSDH